jgi:Holliday junction resolvase RusA-like endonuclease
MGSLGEPGAVITFLFDITIPGPPVPKGRPRTVTNAKSGTHTFTPDLTRAWESKATACLLKARVPKIKPGIPIWLHVEIAGRWAKGEAGTIFDVSRPDIDNVVKTVMDALAPSAKNKTAWTRILGDDAQICALSAMKRTLGEDEEPFVRLIVFEMEPKFSNIFSSMIDPLVPSR